MKRFHVHMHVTDLSKNIAFYSAMFNAQPAKHETDYAKWMLEDPPLNFAISTRGSKDGIDHLGIQVDNDGDLVTMKTQAKNADMSLLDEGATSCCYANSNKYWLTDPQGTAWEQFHTLSDIPVFGKPVDKDLSQTLATAPVAAPDVMTIAAPAAAAKRSCC